MHFSFLFCTSSSYAVNSKASSGNRITIQGLTNGNQYVCTMVARAATGGVLPRAINSPSSNPTPIFTPSIQGSTFIVID